MISVYFKSMKKSDFARQYVKERFASVVAKFPELMSSRIRVTLEMENSPLNPGPDCFRVKVFVSSGRFKGIVVSRSDLTLYGAVAQVCEQSLEIFNRHGDRQRVIGRRLARQLAV